jgi:hypothetical protein
MAYRKISLYVISTYIKRTNLPDLLVDVNFKIVVIWQLGQYMLHIEWIVSALSVHLDFVVSPYDPVALLLWVKSTTQWVDLAHFHS